MPSIAPILAMSLLLGFGPGPASAFGISAAASGQSVRPVVVDFGTRAVGETSVASASVVNQGADPIELGPLGIVDRGEPGAVEAFGLAGGTCLESELTVLQPGASCTIEVSFTPPRVGGWLGEVRVAVDAFASSLSVELRGTARPQGRVLAVSAQSR